MVNVFMLVTRKKDEDAHFEAIAAGATDALPILKTYSKLPHRAIPS